MGKIENFQHFIAHSCKNRNQSLGFQTELFYMQKNSFARNFL